MSSLYLHVPFRAAPRPYDDAAYESHTGAKQERYLVALRRELREHAESRLGDEPVATTYIGGGRPSLLSPEALRHLGDALGVVVDPSDLWEATVELSPADVTPARLDALRDIGTTRVSVDALSFEPSVLGAAGAPHTAADARDAVARLQDAGFDSFSVELLFGRPGLSLPTWTDTLQRAIDLGIPHVSLQEASPDAETDDDMRAEQLERAMRLLSDAGYDQYGLPHFARPSHRSAHQERYYEHCRYVGAGPSAASFWGPTLRPADHAERWTNVAPLDAYASALAAGCSPVAERETLNQQGLVREYVLLRLEAGTLDPQVLRTRYGISLRDTASATLARLDEADLLRLGEDELRLTPRGRLLTDAIARRLVAALP